MDADKLTSILSKSGLSDYEAIVYTALLRVGDTSISNIPNLCDIPRTRAYDVVHSLENRGLVETYEGTKQRAKVLDPSPLLDQLKTHSADVLDASEKIETMWQESGAQLSSISVFQEYRQALAKAATEFESAENLISLSARPDDLELLSSSLRSALDRGVSVRLTVQDTDQFERIDRKEEIYPKVATEVRECESSVPFMTVYDGSNGIFAIQDNHGNEYGMLIQDHFLTSMFHWFFQMQLWEPWNRVYSASSDSKNLYVSIHELIRDFRLTNVNESKISVRIKGYETNTGNEVDFEGTIVDVVQADNIDSSVEVPLVQATLLVNKGGETVTVGGYGAIIEDIRSYSIQILSVE